MNPPVWQAEGMYTRLVLPAWKKGPCTQTHVQKRMYTYTVYFGPRDNMGLVNSPKLKFLIANIETNRKIVSGANID